MKTRIKEEQETNGSFSMAGDCDEDFFGILLGYMGGDAEASAAFCEIAISDTSGDALGKAMREFNMSADAEWEIRQAYEKIFGADEPDSIQTPEVHQFNIPGEIDENRMPADIGEIKKCKSGKHRCTTGGACTSKACNHPVKGMATLEIQEKKKTMKLARLLEQMIREEIHISCGGSLEELNGVDYDLDMPAEEEEGSHTLGPEPDVRTQNTDTVGSISEDWEDEDPHDAPPAGGMKLRPRRREVDEVIDDVIVDLERGPGQMTKEDVIALLQHIANIYTGS